MSSLGSEFLCSVKCAESRRWPYRPPVSDDDEGITAVETTGGESVQLQRVQHAGVLTSQKQPEHGIADMRLLQPDDVLWVRRTSESKQRRCSLCFCLSYSEIRMFTTVCRFRRWTLHFTKIHFSLNLCATLESISN